MNIESWLQLVSWQAVFDVLLVAIVIYNLLLLIRGTRAVQMLLGILFVAAAYYGAGVLGFETLHETLGNFFFVLPFAIVVLFQHEIRRALAQFGRNPLLGFSSQRKVESSFSEIVVAVQTLSARRIGALIVLERTQGLRNYIENGVELDARVFYGLLIHLFLPAGPLHDGAVIIQGDRIASAASFLPLSLNPELPENLGSRHRAALGISEETDALAVVVSEETGIISIAEQGHLIRDLEPKDLRNHLYRYLLPDLHPGAGGTAA